MIEKKKHKWLTIALGAAAIGVYRAYKGKGIFNKMRFADQHEAIAKYVDANHPGAVYSNIEAVGEGWTSVITDYPDKFLLYVTTSNDGVYIFEETKI